MPSLRTVIGGEVWILILAFFGVVVIGLLDGTINTRHLLFSKRDGKWEFSPARVQLLVVTIGAAFQYLFEVLHQPGSCKLPEAPNSLLTVLGGSHAMYLGSKARSMLFNNGQNSNRSKTERRT